MKYYIILILSALLFVACSSTSQERHNNNPNQDKYIISDQFDSTKIIAAIKPSGYPWNKKGYLADVTRPIREIDTTGKYYPNASSPPTQFQFKIIKSDSVKFYIGNTDESSCIKIEDAVLDSGIYCLGFQKLEVSGILVFKLQTTDTILNKKVIFWP